MDGISDKKLLNIGNSIGNNDKLLALALELDFTYAEYKNYKATNQGAGDVTSAGTISMLFCWREKMKREEQVRVLSCALEKVGLVEVAEEHLKERAEAQQLAPNDAIDRAIHVKRNLGERINENVSEGQLLQISREFPNEIFDSFCLRLGVGLNQSSNILTKHCKDYHKAMMEILMMWKNRTCGPCEELEGALESSGAADLIGSILYKPN
ncbi:uncharacterized protein LOC121419786 [Lytechinus variegatus]|uniref:uncharacterized protein LOC121419786 n=1 Tax=Lytechinus variegatus TaxID=7654 RepID=UPI001BB209BC|nr:uncharacterized protein LOC121419786 [Lytechinus variegatus]XP_041470175.1 uncharacterized protein LOC121419786 [Lytechinus variegatus]